MILQSSPLLSQVLLYPLRFVCRSVWTCIDCGHDGWERETITADRQKLSIGRAAISRIFFINFLSSLDGDCEWIYSDLVVFDTHQIKLDSNFRLALCTRVAQLVRIRIQNTDDEKKRKEEEFWVEILFD